MNLRSFVAVVCAGLVAGASFGSVGAGKGIADISNADRAAAAKRGRLTPEVRERGGVGAATDERAGNQVGSPSTACDFTGFLQNELVNGAYSGGAGSGGTVRTNLGVSFTGATALNTWNGCCSPDAGIAYSPAGSMVISSSAASFWRGIDFHFTSTVTMTVEVWSGANATGTLIQTVAVPANVPSTSSYSTWTLRQIAFSSIAKSVKITGTGNRWGIDRLTALVGCPAPTSASDDCNGNGQSDACEIANGLVQDCNANGKPDSCDIAGTTNQPIHISFEEFQGSFKTPITNQYPGLIFETGSGGAKWTANDVTTTLNGSGWNAIGWDCQTEQPNGVSSGPGEYWLCGKVWCSPQDPFVSAGTIRLTGNGASYFQTRYCAGSTLSLIAYDSNGLEIDRDSGPANRRLTEGNQSGPGTLRVEAPIGKRIASVEITDSGNFWVIDGITTDVGVVAPLPDCNANGIIDSCEIASGAVADCNGNGVPDSCDIAGGMADCNGNGALDSCELASGSAVDQNGNGVPDSCDPYPTLTLTANAAACNAIGSVIDVDARLSGVLNLVVAGQVVLDWDPSKLQLLETNPGDAPYVANYVIDSASGQALILVSSSQGGTGTTAPSAIVSRLKFQVIGGSCDGSGTSVGFGTAAGGFETQFTDGFGTSIEPTLVASAGFVADDGAPVLSNVPANVSVQAFAGENGYAQVTLGSPTATDGCQSGVTLNGTRSDGMALTAAWPSGMTTVTWTAVDACGNAAPPAYTTVTVDPTNTMDLSAAFGGDFAGASRSLSLTMLGGAGTQSRTQTVSIPWGGASSFSVNDLPVDDYTCATIEDPARSLKARVTVSDTGSVWTAAAATMVLGDLINDEVIDVLDWGAYVVSNPAADLNADGFINAVDGNIILANYTRRGDGVCGSSANGPRDPILAITVADVVSMGLPELAGADLNGDGWIDQADIDLGH